jgi:hypothetical protein
LDFLGNYIRVDTDFIFKTITVNVRFLLKLHVLLVTLKDVYIILL